MPLTARIANTSERVDLTRFKDPRSELGPNDYLCPACGGEMFLRAGKIIRPHFAHKQSCRSEYDWHPESVEHITTKSTLAQYFRDQYGEKASVELEERVDAARRIADVMITFQNGTKVAHEIQLASITIGEIDERSRSYAKAGIDVYWWLGNTANSKTNRDHCVASFGFCGLVDFTVSNERVDITSKPIEG